MSQYDTGRIAKRLAEMQCPMPACTGALVHRPNYPPTEGDKVPGWHIGCDGDPMHVWDKESLYYLKPKLLVGERHQIEGRRGRYVYQEWAEATAASEWVDA